MKNSVGNGIDRSVESQTASVGVGTVWTVPYYIY